MKEYYIVDRIEGENVILESFYNDMITVKKEKIIGDIKDGDLLIKKGDLYYYDKEKTIKRKKLISDITKDIWK